MNIWAGTDIRTREPVVIYDTPLRVKVGLIDEWVITGEQIEHMAIATSSYLGTAAVIWVRDETEDSEDFLVIEAAPRDDIAGQRHEAALRAARDNVEREFELARLWQASDKGDRPSTDELLDHIIRHALKEQRRGH